MKRLVLLFAVCLLAAPASAHEIRPSYLEIVEHADGRVQVIWKQPIMGDLSLPIRPQLSSGWLEDHEGSMSHTDMYLIREWEIPASAGPLTGQTVRIQGLEETYIDVLLRVTRADGATATRLLTAAAPSLEIGTDTTTPRSAYLWLGIDHILLGIDHLLFVLGLLIIVGRRWMLLFETISAFTVAHSLTLAASTLGIVRLPSAPLNAIVALSILFVGAEIMRQRQGETSVTIEHPWIAAFGFGLVHGFGFASGLSMLGVPRQEVLIALLLFNVGVELGQLSFVALYLVATRAVRALAVPQPGWSGAIPAYVIGSLGAYWTITQMVVLLAVNR